MDPRKVNWDEQVGHFTFDEALARLGPPVVVGEVPDGKFAEWILRRSPQISFGFGVGSSSYGPHSAVGTGVGTSVTPPPHGENLRLKFGPDGVLKEWMRLKY